MTQNNSENSPTSKSVKLSQLVAMRIPFGIGKRLMLAFGIVATFSVLVSFVAWQTLSHLSNHQKALTSRDVPAITGALILDNRASRLIAAAPLLNFAESQSERLAHKGDIQNILDQARLLTDDLGPLVADQQAIIQLSDLFAKLEDVIIELDQHVSNRIAITEKRRLLSVELGKIRNRINKLVEPLSSSITDDLVANSDGWYEVLEETITLAKSGVYSEPDVTELEIAPIRAVSYHSAVLGYKNEMTVMVGLLSEGGQSETLADVKKIQKAFKASLLALVEPMGVLSEGGDISKLQKLLTKVMTLGDRGILDKNILKLRVEELKLQKQETALIEKSRQYSVELADAVSQIVTQVEKDMEVTIVNNDQTSQQTIITLAIMAAMALILSAAIGWIYVARNLIARLSRLGTSMTNLAKGDLSVRVNRNGRDEISRMGAALAVLRNGLRDADRLKLVQEKERASLLQEKKQHAAQLADEFDNSVGSAMGVLFESVGNVREKAGHMNEKSQQTLVETEEVSEASRDISKDIALVASSTEELSASIGLIRQKVEESSAVSSEAVGFATKMDQHITRLEDGANEIENVIALINSIADKTNLLALNATIEAARAGDAGKGFAVVASEVKGLANQTSTAIEDIRDIIGKLQGEVSETVLINKDIFGIIEKIDHHASNIAAAIDQQTTATAEISQTVTVAAGHVDLITHRVAAVSEDAAMTGQLTREVLADMGEIEQYSTSMQQDVQEFLQHVRDNP